MTRSYLPAGLVVGIAVLVVVWGSYSAAKHVGSTYIDPSHRFSVQLPGRVTVEYIRADGGAIETLYLDADSASEVQVTITSWPDSSSMLTKEAAERDYPSISGFDIQPVSVAGVVGLAFEDSKIGQSEVWFVSGGYLYQLVAHGNGAPLLRDIISNWKLN